MENITNNSLYSSKSGDVNSENSKDENVNKSLDSNESPRHNKPQITFPLDFITEKINENDKNILDYSNYFENMRQDLVNNIKDIDFQLEYFSKNYKDYDVSFSDKIQWVIDNFFNSISKSKEVIKYFDELNMMAQNLNYKLNKNIKNKNLIETEHLENRHKYNQLSNEFNELKEKYTVLRRRSIDYSSALDDMIHEKLNEEIVHLTNEKNNMFRRYSTVLTEYESFKNTMQKNITSKNKEYKIISELKNKNKFYENQIKNLKDNINTLNNIIEEQNKKRQIEDQEESLNREKIINNEIKENEIIDKGIDLYSLLIDSEENKEEIKDEKNLKNTYNLKNENLIKDENKLKKNEEITKSLNVICKEKNFDIRCNKIVKNNDYIKKINIISISFNIFIILLIIGNNHYKL